MEYRFTCSFRDIRICKTKLTIWDFLHKPNSRIVSDINKVKMSTPLTITHPKLPIQSYSINVCDIKHAAAPPATTYSFKPTNRFHKHNVRSELHLTHCNEPKLLIIKTNGLSVLEHLK